MFFFLNCIKYIGIEILQIALALDTAKDFTENNEDDELIKRFRTDGFMMYAIKECYDLFIVILCAIMTGEREKK